MSVHLQADLTALHKDLLSMSASVEDMIHRAVAQLSSPSIDDARDLIDIGAYVPGANPVVDRGLRLEPAMQAFLRQPMDVIADRDVAAVFREFGHAAVVDEHGDAVFVDALRLRAGNAGAWCWLYTMCGNH